MFMVVSWIFLKNFNAIQINSDPAQIILYSVQHFKILALSYETNFSVVDQWTDAVDLGKL